MFLTRLREHLIAQRRAVVALGSGLLLVGGIVLIAAVFSLEGRARWREAQVTHVSGELFLRGPHEGRDVVRIDNREVVERMMKVLQAGRPTSDRKEQGIAVLVLYSGQSKIATIEVTEYGLVRIDRAAYSVDTDELIRILASQREPDRRRTTDTPTKKTRPQESRGNKTEAQDPFAKASPGLFPVGPRLTATRQTEDRRL